MWFAEFLLAFAIALVFTFILLAIFGRRQPGEAGDGFAAFLFLFLILFLTIWAVGSWVTPFGPLAWGIPWVPFVLGGIVLAILLAAIWPLDYRRGQDRTERGDTPSETVEPRTARARSSAPALGGFFWILLFVLAAAILLGYIV